MSTRQELEKSIPDKYTVLTIRINVKTPEAYALVRDKETTKKLGLKSDNAGQTWKEVYFPDDSD